MFNQFNLRGIFAAAFLLFALFLTSSTVYADVTAIDFGSATWSYLDNGTNQGTAWTGATFNDATWTRGNLAPFGYGDQGQATTVSFGADASNKFATTYFRNTFAGNATLFPKGVKLRLQRNDGAIVYVNGVEVMRSNLPTGVVGYKTFASSEVGDEGEDSAAVKEMVLPSTSFSATGVNTIAVEIHSSSLTNNSLFFDIQVIGLTSTASVSRAPYLQNGTPTSGVVRWSTNIPTKGVVKYGTSKDNLDKTLSELAGTNMVHEIAISGLTPNTIYYYSIGSDTETYEGGDDSHFFKTFPVDNKVAPYRFWVLGDPGTANANQMKVRDDYYSFNGSRFTDLTVMLGDNAYNSGLDSEYQSAVFDMYKTINRQTFIAPTIGNHDLNQAPEPTGTEAYFSNFTLPTAGEAGGLASGTESYYSFNYGNAHFVCLDSQSTTGRAVGSTMLTWLENDLKQNNKLWVIAFFHHPPYTGGTHKSDTESDLGEVRTNINPILEKYGVDLILNGHSHVYERSFLINGHTGLANTFNASTMVIQGGNGRPASSIDATGAYKKPNIIQANQKGAVYVTAGSSGQKGSGAIQKFPAMFVQFYQIGSVVLDLNGNRLDVTFLGETPQTGLAEQGVKSRQNATTAAVISDSFSIVKANSGVTASRPEAPNQLSAAPNQNGAIELNWVNNSQLVDGSLVERCNGLNCNNFVEIGRTVLDFNTFTDENVTGGTTYTYRVRAYNISGSSEFSNIIFATAPSVTPNAPSNLAFQTANIRRTFLTWSDNSSNETGFAIERCETESCETPVVIGRVAANVTKFTGKQSAFGKSGFFRVRAFNNAGNSETSNLTSIRKR